MLWGLGRKILDFSRQNLGRVSGVGRAIGLESIAIDWCRVSCSVCQRSDGGWLLIVLVRSPLKDVKADGRLVETVHISWQSRVSQAVISE